MKYIEMDALGCFYRRIGACAIIEREGEGDAITVRK